MTDNRNEIVWRDGIALDRQTAQKWDLLKARFPHLQLTQGVRSGAAASGNTHRGLGVLDLYLGGHAWRDVLRYAFEIGFFGWYRPELWRGKTRVWKSHIHLGVRGNAKMDPSLKAQEVSWRNLRNGLVGNGPDAFTWRPKNFRQPATYTTAAPKPPKPPKVDAKAKPLINASFLNMAGNGKVLFHTFDARLPRMVKAMVAGSPAIVAAAEVQPGQRGKVTRALEPHGYRLIAWDSENMLAVWGKSNVTSVGFSMARFTQQDGGNKEGVLRVKFRINGSRFQIGVLHLDYNSAESKKRSNLREAVTALERFGRKTLLPDWKSRTLIIGDFNDEDVAAKVLPQLGFKEIAIGAKIDQAWVGSKRKVRGAARTAAAKVKSDHPRILVRLGQA